VSAPEPEWTPSNYFNYFTEVEDHFRQARGTGGWWMSTLDWALVEAWKNSGVPLEAVLRGIDAAMVKWHSRKKKLRMVNSVVYCTQAVMEEAQIMAGAAPRKESRPVEAPFTIEELRGFLERNACTLRERGYRELAASLDAILGELEKHYEDLQALDQRLTVLEEKLAAAEQLKQTEDDLTGDRMSIVRELAPYRGKMSADQIAMLERQYLMRKLLDRGRLPRLSLFYLT